MIQKLIYIYIPVGKGDKKGKDSKGKKKDSKEDKAPAIVSNLHMLAIATALDVQNHCLVYCT